MLLGVHTGLHDQISVNDIGIDNVTAADGLAVGRASGFVGRAMQQLIDGYYTIHDERLYELIALLNQTENIQLEPSAVAGMMGPYYVQTSPDYLALHQFTAEQLQQVTHVIWVTGAAWCHLMKCKNIYRTFKINKETLEKSPILRLGFNQIIF